MSSTYTHSEAQTFTVTNAKYLASKVETDLMRLHHYYYNRHKRPTLEEIRNYYGELVLLQKLDLLEDIEYGFVSMSEKRWVKALKYTARQGGVLTADEDPGRIQFTHIPDHAKFTSFLRYNSRWYSAPYDREEFLSKTPIRRTSGSEYSGNWKQQKSYSSGGRGLLRSGI